MSAQDCTGFSTESLIAQEATQSQANQDRCSPSATNSDFPFRGSHEGGCIPILLSTFLIFQGHSCHTNALQPLARAVKQTRAWKGHSLTRSGKGICVMQNSPSFLSGVPVRSTNLLAHTGGSKWSRQRLKTRLISVPRDTAHPSVTVKCGTPKRRKPKKTQLHRGC